MHEMSIAHELVDSVAEAARQAGATRVVRVTVRVGALSGVVAESLAFAYEVAAAGTLLAGSELLIERVPLALLCANCGPVNPADPRAQCPRCGEPAAVTAGRELDVVSMEIDDSGPSGADEPAAVAAGRAS